jgi:DNA-binding XRE family transcriptional regulator
MVPSRGESPATGDANTLPASLPDLGRSLQLAREQAELTVTVAAERLGISDTALMALENGNVGLQHDRIETLRNLRAYANSLGLQGDHYVLVAVEHWPAGVQPFGTTGDTALVPVVSISSAPAGGHSPVGGGAIWASDATGVAEATTTGVFEPVTRPVVLSDIGLVSDASLSDTGQVPMVDTGEVPAVQLAVPRFLKVLVGLVTFLVVVGGVALIEHDNVDHWFHNARSATAHWYDNAKVAVGITSSPKAHATAARKSSSTGTKDGIVNVTTDPSGRSATFNVALASFQVEIKAVNGPCWVQAVAAGSPRTVFGQVLQAGQSHVFPVTSSMTIQTGSGAGRAYIFTGSKQIGSFVPTQVPFTMTFNATN